MARSVQAIVRIQLVLTLKCGELIAVREFEERIVNNLYKPDQTGHVECCRSVQ